MDFSSITNFFTQIRTSYSQVESPIRLALSVLVFIVFLPWIAWLLNGLSWLIQKINVQWSDKIKKFLSNITFKSDLFFLQLTSPLALYVVIVLTTIALIFYVYNNSKNVNNYLLSAMIALIGVIFTGAFKLHCDMRTNAMALLRESRKTTKLKNASKRLKEFKKKNPLSTEGQIIQLLEASDEESIAVRDSIQIIANFFEEIAIYIKFKEVYEPILADFYKGTLINFYIQIEDYLTILRKKRGKKGELLYCNMEALYQKWLTAEDLPKLS